MGILVLGKPFVKQGKANKYVLAKCDACGKEFETIWGARNRIKSCGCLRPKPSRLKHGNCMKHSDSETATYTSWRAMRERCKNPNDKMWPEYGGRGIEVCKRWDSFENFLSDMGSRPTGTTLDRINQDKGYSKENCRWADKKTQNRNKRDNRMLTIYGKTMCLADWHEIVAHQVSYDAIKRRLQRGWDHKQAVFGKAE
jgi:hypothetical protein